MKSWQFGRINSLIYRLYDLIRNRLNYRLADYLYSFIAHQSAINIIEAGSGPGYCASLLNQKPNVKTTLILDTDKQVLRLAQKRDKTLKTIKADILKMPFKKNTFNLVYNSSTLEHINNKVKAFSEMVRVCKPCGYIFVGIPYKFGPLFIFTLFPKSGKIRKWLGKFIPTHKVLSWQKKHPIKLIDQKFYFFNFFIGFLFKKT